MSPWTAPPFRFCLIMLIFSLVAGFDLPTALAADNLPPQREAALSELAETVQHTAQLPGGAAVAATLDDDIPIWCPRCFLGTDNVYSGEGIRYLVVRLIVGNHTIAPLELNRRKITLTTDRQTLTAGERPPSFREMPLEIDWHPQGHIRSQRELETPESITIPPSRSVEFWCVFAPLDASPGVPPLTLSLSFANGQNAELDLNAQQQARLGLTTEFIGPEHALQILTVHGQLNRISTGTLAAAMKGAAEQGCRRFLIAWDDAAAPSDDAIYSWLLTTVVESGRDNALYLQMPMLPAVIDLGLANLPEENRDLFVAGDASATHIFERSDEAAIALLRDIYDHVDRAVVLEQVRDGHPWSQQAALETAGNRLGTDALPLLLELSRRESGPLRRAALIALGQQQSPLAVERLKQVALGTDATDAIAALRSLMTGASPGDRQLVLELLDSPLSVPPVARIDLLAETYHPDWNPVLAAAVQSPLPEVRERALTALRQLGHPDLVEMAIEALSDENQSVRESAFSVLVDRTDHRSEQAALKFALDQLAQGRVPPSALTLIERLRASEAAPLLLKQIRSSTLPRETLIVTLGTIGTDDDLRALLNEMQDLSAEEQVAALEFAPVLSTAAQLELARNAASSDEVILRVAALELLKRIGTDDVVQILKMMYAQGPDDEREMVCMTLGEIGLDAAVQALRTLRQQAVQEDDSEALNAVDQGLRNWRSRLLCRIRPDSFQRGRS